MILSIELKHFTSAVWMGVHRSTLTALLFTHNSRCGQNYKYMSRSMTASWSVACRTYSGEVVVRAKACVDAPHSSVLAEKLCIEERIHLDQ